MTSPLPSNTGGTRPASISIPMPQFKDTPVEESTKEDQDKTEEKEEEKEMKSSSKEDVTLSTQQLSSSAATTSYIDAFNKITYWVCFGFSCPSQTTDGAMEVLSFWLEKE